MIELKGKNLCFSFPELHKDAVLNIQFQRTLRLPDDGKIYPLPPGLGAFPLKHVDDHLDRVPAKWQEHGGVMLPMFQSEALWINFTAWSNYPMLVKIATGKINAVTGEEYRPGAHRNPQDYVVVPQQPWLDGYCFEKGEVRQFVAMPLGSGYSVEEQLTHAAEHGGLQIQVYPLKKEVWERRQKAVKDYRPFLMEKPSASPIMASLPADMGLAPGGRMRQEIAEDPHKLSDWDLRTSSRCFVHLCNSLHWRAVTGEAPPTIPPTARQYSEAGLPWFDHYGEGEAVPGGEKFAGVKTVKEMGEQKGEQPLPENETAEPKEVVIVKQKNVVREGSF